MLPALVTSQGMIKKWVSNVRVWHSGRKVRALAWWERERALGKTRFVIRTAMIYSLFMTASQDLFSYGVEREARFSRFLFNAVFYSLGGLFVGHVAWWDRERSYKNTLREIRVETIAAGATTPDDQDY